MTRGTRPPVAVEARRHPAAQMGERHRALWRCRSPRTPRGRCGPRRRDRQRSAPSRRPRPHRRGAARRSARRSDRPRRPSSVALLAARQVVVGDAVEPRLAGLAIGDVARDDPAVAVVAHAEALVEARELAGAIVELLFLEGVGLARRGRRSSGTAAPPACSLVDGRAVGQGNSGATSNFMTSITTRPSSVSKWFIGWKT